MEAETTNPYQSPRPAAEIDAAHADAPLPGNAAVVTPEIMVRAHRLHRPVRYLVLRVLRLAAGLASLSFAAVFLYGGNLFSAVLMGALGIFFLLRAVLVGRLLLRSVRKQYEQMGKEREIVTYVATPEHLHIMTSDADLRIPWSSFRKWKEADSLILAYRHNKLFQVIPMDQLDAQTQCDIRQNLTAHSVKV